MDVAEGENVGVVQSAAGIAEIMRTGRSLLHTVIPSNARNLCARQQRECASKKELYRKAVKS